MHVRVGLSLMPQADFAAAALPLLREGAVDVLEWGPDMSEGPGWQPPDWYRALVGHYAGEGALLAHGVAGSLLSHATDEAFESWLGTVAEAVAAFPVLGFSEHLGFARTPRWARLPPLPARPDTPTIALARDRLKQLRDATNAPVGLENLALALSDTDLDARGSFLEAILAPVDGFLQLDLHNLWCAAVNFDRDPIRLMERYPLHRVRRIHLSGGSWTSVPGMDRPFRRDTHDDGVPDEVHALLPAALDRCPALHDVILEQLGGTIDAQTYTADFQRIRAAVETGPSGVVDSPDITPIEPVDEAPGPARWQADLVDAIETGAPWESWPAPLDAHAAGVAKSLIGRWGRRASQEEP